MKMPKINFDPLLNDSEDTLFERIYKNSGASCFLVYLRCKYSHQTEWEYLIECCELCNRNDIVWFNDWWEGQQDVEYLGIAVIDLPKGG